MSKAGDCAFPNSNSDYGFAPEFGLTKREYFAAMAMQGVVARSYGNSADVAIDALRIADALLKELEK